MKQLILDVEIEQTEENITQQIYDKSNSVIGNIYRRTFYSIFALPRNNVKIPSRRQQCNPAQRILCIVYIFIGISLF